MIDSETKAKLEQLSDSKGYEKDCYWSRPFLIRENDIIINEEKKSKKLRTESNLWGRDLTKDLANEVKEAYEYNLNTIILLTGLPGLGKTEAGMSLDLSFLEDFRTNIFEEWSDFKLEYSNIPESELELQFVANLDFPTEIAKSITGKQKIIEIGDDFWVIRKFNGFIAAYNRKIMSNSLGALMTLI